MSLWTRLWAWLERHLPDLTGDCTTDPEGDDHRPHKFPRAAIGEEVLGWKCEACGAWIREFGEYQPGECSVDWRRAS